MQLRCSYCQTMFALSRDQILAALEHMSEHDQIYFDAHCPSCRRANRVERARLERFFPDWQQAIKTMAKESAQVETEAAKPVKPASSTTKEKTPATASPKKKSHTSKSASASKVKPAAPAAPKAKKTMPAAASKSKKPTGSKKK